METAPETADLGAPPSDAEKAPEPTRTGATPVQPREPLVRAVLAQLSETIRRGPDGSVEVRLAPDELGQLRLTMTQGDGTIHVQIVAERPETLDLIRRHAELLAEELRAEGFGRAEFAFGERRGDGRGDDVGPDTAPQADADDVPATQRTAMQPAGVDRLDLRL